MSQQVLSVELRDKVGKGVCRKLRSAGKIPGVVYGKGMESIPVTVNPKELSAAIAGEGGLNHLITLTGGVSLDGVTVIVSDLQRNCLKGNPTHVDLHKISMTEKLQVTVPLTFVGASIGVKAGGMLDPLMHEIEVECLPGNIPEHIEVNVAQLDVGESIHVGDLVLPEGVKVLTDAKASLVSVLAALVVESVEE
jgi:large subunit ribosomal protein L25